MCPVGPFLVGFMVNKVTVGEVLFRVLRFSPISIIPPAPHAISSSDLLVRERQMAEGWGPFGNRGASRKKSACFFLSYKRVKTCFENRPL
jgi:hypothetical protein